jgi:hypothetical protein
MNGRLESRPTGRLESLPYESAPGVLLRLTNSASSGLAMRCNRDAV